MRAATIKHSLLLHSFDRDVLAALELDEVLEPVHDLDAAVRSEQRDVARVEPAC